MLNIGLFYLRVGLYKPHSIRLESSQIISLKCVEKILVDASLFVFPKNDQKKPNQYYPVFLITDLAVRYPDAKKSQRKGL